MDLPIEHLLELLKFEPGSGMVQSILLLLIWLNIRSLKKILSKLEEDHEVRLGKLETRSENHEGRLVHLEPRGS